MVFKMLDLYLSLGLFFLLSIISVLLILAFLDVIQIGLHKNLSGVMIMTNVIFLIILLIYIFVTREWPQQYPHGSLVV